MQSPKTSVQTEAQQTSAFPEKVEVGREYKVLAFDKGPHEASVLLEDSKNGETYELKATCVHEGGD